MGVVAMAIVSCGGSGCRGDGGAGCGCGTGCDCWG